mgnify:CR=1 FL=1
MGLSGVGTSIHLTGTQRCGGCARGLGLCIAPPTAAAPSGDKHQSQQLKPAEGRLRAGPWALLRAAPLLLLKPVEDVLGPPLHLTLAVSAY